MTDKRKNPVGHDRASNVVFGIFNTSNNNDKSRKRQEVKLGCPPLPANSQFYWPVEWR